jgi:hypothetical protein
MVLRITNIPQAAQHALIAMPQVLDALNVDIVTAVERVEVAPVQPLEAVGV